MLIVIVWKDESSNFLSAASLEFLPDYAAAEERVGSSHDLLQDNDASTFPFMAKFSEREIQERPGSMKPVKEMDTLKGNSGTNQSNFTSSFINRVVKQMRERGINKSKQQDVIRHIVNVSTTIPSIKEPIADYTQADITDSERDKRKGMLSRSSNNKNSERDNRKEMLNRRSDQTNKANSFQSVNLLHDYVEDQRREQRNIPYSSSYVEMSFLKIRKVISKGQNKYKNKNIVTNSMEITPFSAKSSHIHSDSPLQQKTENIDKRTWRGSRSHCTTICRRCKDMGHLSLGTKCFNSCWSQDTFYSDLCWHMIN